MSEQFNKKMPLFESFTNEEKPNNMESFLELLKLESDHKSAVIITAENPNAKELSKEDNIKRNAHLEEILKSMNIPYLAIQGQYGGNKENSFLIFDIDKHAGEVLRKQFEQEAFVYIDENDYSLCFEGGKEINTKHIIVGELVDNFSIVNGIKFSIDFKFD